MPADRYRTKGGIAVEGPLGGSLLAIHTRIDALADQSTSFVSQIACLDQRDLGKGAERQTLFLAREAVLQPPRSEAGFRDEEVKPLLVRQLVLFVARLRVAALHGGQHRMPPPMPPKRSRCRDLL